MKNRQFSKIALLALSLALMIGAIFAMTANAATTPEITNMNVQYTDKFCLVYAVPANTVQGGSATLYLYDADPAEGAEPIKDYTVSKITPAGGTEVGGVGLDYEAYVFYTDGVAAMALDKVFYAQVIDANNNKSDVKTYSVVEYLYTRLAEVDGKPNTEKQNTLYKTVIAFGTAAQDQFLTTEELANTTLISDYCYVSAAEGYTIEGKSAGVFPQNKPLAVAKAGNSVSGFNLTTYTGYDATEEVSTELKSGSYLTIENANRAHISAGAIIRTYKENVLTFDDDTVKSNPAALGTNFTGDSWDMRTNRVKVAEDTVFDKVSNVTKLHLKENRFSIHPKQGCEASEATAFELSFDMKLDTSTVTAETWANIEAREDPYFKTNLYFYVNNSTDQIDQIIFTVLDDGRLQISLWDTYYDKLRDTVDTTVYANEYNSFRFVIRYGAQGNTYFDIYVNNFSDTPTATFTSGGNGTLSYGITKASLGAVANEAGGDFGATYYFDNFWCGYVK